MSLKKIEGVKSSPNAFVTQTHCYIYLLEDQVQFLSPMGENKGLSISGSVIFFRICNFRGYHANESPMIIF